MAMEMSIGAVSAATQIPAGTLRTWERRYGWPSPTRTGGGQRLYSADDVDRLRRVSRALARGHRPAQILSMEGAALDALVDAVPAGGGWIALVRSLDGEGLQSAFRLASMTDGMVEFLELRAVPFLREVGEAWADGTIQTFHEHFATEQVRDFLAPIWRAVSAQQRGATAVLATLPGDAHALGLHLVATVLALRGWRVVYLGPDTPLGDLRDAVAQSKASALFVGVSITQRRADRSLAELRRMVPKDVRVVAGGAGAPVGVVGVDRVERLGEIPPSPEVLS